MPSQWGDKDLESGQTAEAELFATEGGPAEDGNH